MLILIHFLRICIQQFFSMPIRIQQLFECWSVSSLNKFVKKITLRRVFLHSRILIHKRLENLPRGKGNSLVPQAGEKSSKISGKFGLDRDQSHRAPWGEKHFPVRHFDNFNFRPVVSASVFWKYASYACLQPKTRYDLNSEYVEFFLYRSIIFILKRRGSNLWEMKPFFKYN